MARAGVTKSYVNFIGGKHSDGSALASPENTARILQNVDLETSGKISRRLGLDYENDFVLSTEVFTDAQLRAATVGFYEWTTVANDGRRNFYVVRVGETLYIYNQSGVVTSDTRLGTVDISTFSVVPASSTKSDVQLASGKGVLFVTGEFYNPFFVSYDSVLETFSTTAIDIKIRDFEGVDDGLAIDTVPPILTDLHHYNLLNQGWRESRLQSVAYPSNSEIEYLGIKVNSDGDREFSTSFLRSQTFGNTQAPRGHFLLNAFEEDRLTASGIFGLPLGGTLKRPRSVAFFAGRVWYGGLDGKVFFSQIVERLDLVGECFQAQDPTSEDFNELLDTDGGVVPIPDVGEIYKLLNVGNSVLVMASNGIWEIGGGTDNFTANNSAVSKVSEVGIVNYNTVVQVENTVYFWSEEGIFIIAPDNISGRLVANSVSDNRINKDYQTIPAVSRLAAQGAYNRVNKKIFWSYHDGLQSTAGSLTAKFNAMLIYDVQLNAFYDYRIEDAGVNGFGSFMSGLLKGTARNEGSLTENVTVNDVQVTANGVLVQSTVTFTGAGEVAPKVLTFALSGTSWKITFSEFRSRSFHDWFSQDNLGANYESIVETNPESLGEVTLEKQATYLFTYYDFHRDGYTSATTNPRVDAGKGFRVGQNLIEILRKGFPNARVTQNTVEILRQGTPKSRVTQNAIEILRGL